MTGVTGGDGGDLIFGYHACVCVCARARGGREGDIGRMGNLAPCEPRCEELPPCKP